MGRLGSAPTLLLLALASSQIVACGEEPTYTLADLVSHLEARGVAVEDTLDLARMGAPSAVPGRMYIVTLSDDTELLVHVTDDEGTARGVVGLESESGAVAGRMGVTDADVYSSGTTFGNLAVLVKDGTPAERVEALEETLGG